MASTWPSRDAARFYLAAMIDGEGSVGLPRLKRSGQVRSARIDINNTDYALIERCQSACEFLDIECEVLLVENGRRPRWKAKWVVRIRRIENVCQLWQEVPIWSPSKRERLEVLVKRSLIFRRPNRAQFVDALDSSGGSPTRTTRKLGVSKTSVYNWKKRYSVA